MADAWHTPRFQDTLRRLATVDEAFAEDQAGLALGPASATSLDAKTVALLQVAACVATGSAACLHWSVSRALSTGVTADEITDALLAIIPVTGLSQIVAAARPVAAALGYDIDTAPEEPDDQ